MLITKTNLVDRYVNLKLNVSLPEGETNGSRWVQNSVYSIVPFSKENDQFSMHACKVTSIHTEVSTIAISKYDKN